MISHDLRQRNFLSAGVGLAVRAGGEEWEGLESWIRHRPRGGGEDFWVDWGSGVVGRVCKVVRSP
jgi:hypothetical protein